MQSQQRGIVRLGVSIVAFLVILLVVIDKFGIAPSLSQSLNNLSKLVEPADAFRPLNGSETVVEILWTFLLATLLGGVIAYRDEYSRYRFSVLQAHMILSVSAALMMMIIGSELARAFGILGAAGIVRYRYRLVSAREASTLIIALGVGLACGTGLYTLAVIATGAVMFILQLPNLLPQRIVHSLFGPQYTVQLKCTVTAEHKESLKENLEKLFLESNVDFIVTSTKYRRGATPETDVTFETSEVTDKQKDDISKSLLGLGVASFSWKRLTEE